MSTTNPTGREPGHAHEAEVEAARCGLIQTREYVAGVAFGVPDDARVSYSTALAKAALADAMPLIRERLAQEVKDGCDDLAVQPCRICRHAAHIVRGATS